MDWDDQVLAEAVAETREDSSFLSDDGSTAAAPMPMPGSFQLQATIEHPLVFLVLDTNVLLSRLHLIQSLHASATQGQFQMVLFFPYVVITELDYMKESKRTCTMPDGSRVTIESRARAAVRWIQDKLLANDPFVIAQPLVHARMAIPVIQPKKNDDHVLHACLLLHLGLIVEEYHIDPTQAGWLYRVALVSGDRALSVKALANGISSIEPRTMPSTLPECHEMFVGLRPPTAHVAASPLMAHTAMSAQQALPRECDTRQHTDFGEASPDVSMHEDTILPVPDQDRSPLASSTPSSGSRKLCLCSKLPVLHYAHGPDEKPVPLGGVASSGVNGSMDMEDDGY
eukprot:TRINITY_DN9213_c0_g1_i3.p1 TRINITY_DN9213_c0_g1~~TRINITY_DN9213_c0_g1_i3.p1  ORF type:complete len:351 (+),score=44.94 TRINITY_DN9213_c0_g1_i3:28-1053(+)